MVPFESFAQLGLKQHRIVLPSYMRQYILPKLLVYASVSWISVTRN